MGNTLKNLTGGSLAFTGGSGLIALLGKLTDVTCYYPYYNCFGSGVRDAFNSFGINPDRFRESAYVFGGHGLIYGGIFSTFLGIAYLLSKKI